MISVGNEVGVDGRSAEILMTVPFPLVPSQSDLPTIAMRSGCRGKTACAGKCRCASKGRTHGGVPHEHLEVIVQPEFSPLQAAVRP